MSGLSRDFENGRRKLLHVQPSLITDIIIHSYSHACQLLATCPCPMQAREANARLRKELQLEQQRREIAVGALVGST